MYFMSRLFSVARAAWYLIIKQIQLHDIQRYQRSLISKALLLLDSNEL